MLQFIEFFCLIQLTSKEEKNRHQNWTQKNNNNKENVWITFHLRGKIDIIFAYINGLYSESLLPARNVRQPLCWKFAKIQREWLIIYQMNDFNDEILLNFTALATRFTSTIRIFHLTILFIIDRSSPPPVLMRRFYSYNWLTVYAYNSFTVLCVCNRLVLKTQLRLCWLRSYRRY